MSFFLLDKSPSWNTWNLTSRTRFASTFFILCRLNYQDRANGPRGGRHKGAWPCFVSFSRRERRRPTEMATVMGARRYMDTLALQY
jgi:hypothetical protein